MFDSLESAVHDAGNWAYALVWVIALLDAVFPVVPSETLVILGGVLSSAGTLSLPAVIVVALVGACMGDNLSYAIGRYFSVPINRWADKKPKRRQRFDWAAEQIRIRGMLLIITARFIPGGRTAVTLTCGITHQPWPKFFASTVVAAGIWATYAAMLGYLGGEAMGDNHTLAFVIAFITALSVSGIIELVRHKLNKRKDLAAPQSGTVEIADAGIDA